jgi:trans-AT polyketide synthase/acyltransferase/oxidoreductase domain-containing protein
MTTGTDLLPDEGNVRSSLLTLDMPLWVGLQGEKVELSTKSPPGDGHGFLLPAIPVGSLGDPAFRERHGLRYNLYGGAMANGISSEAIVIALGKAGLMGSFGAAGLSLERVEKAIQTIQKELPHGSYIFNLINSPNEAGLAEGLVELYLKHHVTTIEASAFLGMTSALVRYRCAGLSRNPDGSVAIQHRIIAKLSRAEVAKRFMEPAPSDLLKQLVGDGKITSQQAELAQRVPMADDVTVEADSGGHTDNRSLVCMLPSMLLLRNQIQATHHYAEQICVGAAGGISTPEAILAAIMMGADYVVTGSINQACVESGTSESVRTLLAQVNSTDVAMAPAADMFEMGVKVQVLKRGTFFPQRAQKLYELYSRYRSLEELPAGERQKLETQIFKCSLEDVWKETEAFFQRRDPKILAEARADGHMKMALIFRWYLGLSSRWATTGEKGREMDYQIWCGPSMGSFNDWTRGTYLESAPNRHVVDVAFHLLTGAAYLARIRFLELLKVRIPVTLSAYQAQKPIVMK